MFSLSSKHLQILVNLDFGDQTFIHGPTLKVKILLIKAFQCCYILNLLDDIAGQTSLVRLIIASVVVKVTRINILRVVPS